MLCRRKEDFKPKFEIYFLLKKTIDKLINLDYKEYMSGYSPSL